jgi:NAD(P)-dependent dehydrogenase (short-subunit alcohol dehydrogenase family)
MDNAVPAVTCHRGQTMKGSTVTVFGGAGFLGRRVVRHLREREFSVRIASRHPDRGHMLFGIDDPQLQSIEADTHDERSVADALAGAYGVVNAVSLYLERGRSQRWISCCCAVLNASAGARALALNVFPIGVRARAIYQLTCRLQPSDRSQMKPTGRAVGDFRGLGRRGMPHRPPPPVCGGVGADVGDRRIS